LCSLYVKGEKKVVFKKNTTLNNHRPISNKSLSILNRGNHVQYEVLLNSCSLIHRFYLLKFFKFQLLVYHIPNFLILSINFLYFNKLAQNQMPDAYMQDRYNQPEAPYPHTHSRIPYNARWSVPLTQENRNLQSLA